MIGFSIATAVLILGTTSPAAAAPSAKQRDEVRKACMADVMRLCPREAAARDRLGIRACLKANVSKTSQACQSSLRAVLPGLENQTSSSRPSSSDRSPPPAPKQ